MPRTKLSKLDLLRYAQDGLNVLIGTHPCPNEYPEEIEEYERHLKEVQRRILLVELAERRKTEEQQHGR